MIPANRLFSGLAASPSAVFLAYGTFEDGDTGPKDLKAFDLRTGAEPDYSFRFAVAERDGEAWRAIPVEQLQWPWQARRRLGETWLRIWHAPP